METTSTNRTIINIGELRAIFHLFQARGIIKTPTNFDSLLAYIGEDKDYFIQIDPRRLLEWDLVLVTFQDRIKICKGFSFFSGFVECEYITLNALLEYREPRQIHIFSDFKKDNLTNGYLHANLQRDDAS
jgi:hypothetical protein